ncbi:Uncharacterised protein [Raoultella planticola]|uniref:Uncharacterized protein n=1 Tax=Raoultella planticola TaxID=575 RepID=A0A485APH4_RAOPL|nr:Uncharacterised protein [Raoultella planticola]
MKQFSGLWPNIVGRAAADNALLERLVKDAQPVLQAAVLIPQSRDRQLESLLLFVRTTAYA